MEQDNIKIDKNSKILFYVFIALLLVSISLTYVRTMVNKDFEVEREEYYEGYYDEE